MATPDKVFKQTYAWFKASIARVLAASAIPAAQKPAVERIVWDVLGVLNPGAPPADPDLSDFRDNGAAAESLAVAAQVVGEVLAALSYVKRAVDGAAAGSPAAALAVIGPVLQQIDRLAHLSAGSRYPSAFSLGKMLLTLSGDAEADPPANHEADKLAALIAGGGVDVANAQAALGIVTLLLGSMLDRSFAQPTASAAGFAQQLIPSVPTLPKLVLDGPGGVTGTLELDAGPPSTIRASLALAFDQSKPIDGTSVALKLTATGGVDVLVPVAPPGPVKASAAGFRIGFDVSRTRTDGALVIGSDSAGVKLSIGTFGVGLVLDDAGPSLRFFASGAKATIKPPDGFLRLILGDGITLGLDLSAEADRAGKLRLVNGTGLHASLPIPTLPTGPFELQLVNLGVDPVDGSFAHLKVEVSASFGVELGPFAASVDRLGILLDVEPARGAIAFAFKPPNGIGLALDAGIVKGGGYLQVDAQGYAGVLELKMLAVGVKAIAILNTQSEAGFSLLLLIFGQFPAIQLSFGFTLTGVGGLIGVQHTTDQTALSASLSAGNLDAILFPDNPVANAPSIIATLRTCFPVKKGGFVIGPMLELGWGTPSLVTVRLGLLVEAEQFTILGQAIVALPPLVSADLALLYLRLDFAGYVRFSPLAIGFDAKLVHSRVAFISITGQFAFRARFGNDPTFVISAGGFHPRFKEVPDDIPMPFDRVGASFDLGIVGVSLKGYFAITSATVQAGAEFKAWADIGIASIEGGIGYDAICYLVPKFHFEVDVHAYLAVHVFGIDFASIHLTGSLAGPGRWRLAGEAKVHTPWPLPDFTVHIDTATGTDRDTPVVTVRVADQLAAAIADRGNWAAQLPKGGDAFLSLASIPADTDVLAHPLGTLTFQQKLVPFELRLAKASGSRIDGPNEFGHGALVLSQDGAPLDDVPSAIAKPDWFAAAQFLELSQDEKLSKPSFESYAAGYELALDGFVTGPVVADTLGFEEADLGAPRRARKARRKPGGLYVDEVHGALAAFGAAGLSPLRDRALTQPVQSIAIAVDPAPVAVVAKTSLQPGAGARATTSVWKAEQARRFDATASAKTLQVAELAEIA